jgi:hypothetical protein
MTYRNQIRERLAGMSRAEIEHMIQRIALRYYCGPGGVEPLPADAPLSGADLVDDLGDLLRVLGLAPR